MTTKTLSLTALLSLALLPGCFDKDSDGDGLTDDQEAELGTDPDNRDTDGDGAADGWEHHHGWDPLDDDTDDDGLLDGEEKDLGSDPLNADSDGDGYLDGDEVTEGSDPLDGDSWIYTGGWPYNNDKDSLGDPGWGDTAKEGVQVPRFVAIDQYGDTVDLYDFAQQGKPMVIDISGNWCGWCHEVAKLLEGESSALDGRGYEPIADMVDNGDIYFITVLYAGNSTSAPATQADLDSWWEQHPNPKVPVLLDAEWEMEGFMSPGGYPSMMYVDENMDIIYYPNSSQEYYVHLLDRLLEDFGE